MSWVTGYDFWLAGQGRLFSASTGIQADGLTEQFYIFGYGGSPTHQDVWFQRQGRELSWGGTRAKSGAGHLGPAHSLPSEGEPLVAKFEARFNPAANLYDTKLVEILPNSSVSSPPWSALTAGSRTRRELPGEWGQSYRFDVHLLIGETFSGSSHRSDAIIAPFGPESSAGLRIVRAPL